MRCLFAGTTPSEHALGPQSDQCVDVVLDGIGRGDVEDLMKEDMGLELADEEQRQRARIGLADGAGA
ncbi:MAG TPA: hypothetical protein VFP80_16905, partial [Thermoanaerobaculia bacterium]|nr:hypothetical protein [Thermoanaerobaculia bacterium]